MKKTESFELDHRNVIAPYVRKAAIDKGELSDIVSKFDLRFVQP
ncbi:S-ribosylhomocysteine lyase [Clostridium tetani]|nr:S-ribosylhomocysteine lyase [Clostridium tetani]CDI49427.1 S-ribosylhomocysteinase [Clostridium tetani 12124569]